MAASRVTGPSTKSDVTADHSSSSTVRAFLDEMVARTCAVVSSHGAKCVDLYHAFNGQDGTAPLGPGFFTPEFGDLNQPGQERVAAEIMKIGFSPLTD